MKITSIGNQNTTFNARYKSSAQISDVLRFENHIAPCFKTYNEKPIVGFYNGKTLSVFTGEDTKCCDSIKIKNFKTRMGQTYLKHTISSTNPTIEKTFAKEENKGVKIFDSFNSLIKQLVSDK
ncbi:MAG: hypothetical protein NC200_06200 [Candidatus Gastranaerophilales bacterium]|nr:hypothetical protein [Candidatus Gastranaerophilales bacterium]